MQSRSSYKKNSSEKETGKPARVLADGTITRIAQQKRDPDRVSVFIDDEFAFGLSMDLAIQEGLKSGLFLSVEEQQALLEKQEEGRARVIALNYVSYQARTVEEVRRKLREKGYENDIIDDAIEYLNEFGYLDDEAYARAYVRSKFSGSGYGPRRLSTDLTKRGVDRSVVDNVLSDAFEDDELKEAALQKGRKRWAALDRETDPRKRRKKVMDFLVRRGFDYALASEVVERLAGE